MSLAEVAERVEKIARASSRGEYPDALAAERALHVDTLKAVAAGASDPVALAREALRSRDYTWMDGPV